MIKLKHFDTRSIIRLYERGRSGELWVEEVMAYTTGDKRVFRRGDFSSQIQVRAGDKDVRYTDACQIEFRTHHYIDVPFCTYTRSGKTLHRSGIWPDIDVKIVDPFTVCPGCEDVKPRANPNNEFQDLYNGTCGEKAHDTFFNLWNQLGRSWFIISECSDHASKHLCEYISEYYTLTNAYLKRRALQINPELRWRPYVTQHDISKHAKWCAKPWHEAALAYYQSKRRCIYRYYESKQRSEELAKKAAKQSARRAQKTVKHQVVEFFQMSHTLATIAKHEQNHTTTAH